jgi:hypothetical protein
VSQGAPGSVTRASSATRRSSGDEASNRPDTATRAPSWHRAARPEPVPPAPRDRAAGSTAQEQRHDGFRVVELADESDVFAAGVLRQPGQQERGPLGCPDTDQRPQHRHVEAVLEIRGDLRFAVQQPAQLRNRAAFAQRPEPAHRFQQRPEPLVVVVLDAAEPLVPSQAVQQGLRSAPADDVREQRRGLRRRDTVVVHGDPGQTLGITFDAKPAGTLSACRTHSRPRDLVGHRHVQRGGDDDVP